MTTTTPVAQQIPLRDFAYVTAGDNYEPTREHIVGGAEVYQVPGREDGAETVVLLEAFEKFMDPHKAIFLIDDGQKVEPWYVSGWQLTEGQAFEGCVFLQRFPLSQGTRQDNGQPIDMSGWMLGPRRCYHLKVSAA